MIPGRSVQARERFKATALLNILRTSMRDLETPLALAASQGLAPPCTVVAGDLNMLQSCMTLALDEACTYVGHEFFGPVTKRNLMPCRTSDHVGWRSGWGRVVLMRRA